MLLESKKLVASRLLNKCQQVNLSNFAGVAVGAGWQALVAFINIGCYYLVGLPIGAVFGFKLKLNALVRTETVT